MIYLKYFEKLKPTSNVYWLIPTDNRLEDSLKEIMKEDFDKDFMIYISNTNSQFVYVGNNPSTNYWEYSRFGKVNIFNKKGYVYLGQVNVHDYELEMIKYNF